MFVFFFGETFEIYFIDWTPSVISAIPRGVPLPHSNVLQYYVKREKFKANDVIFPSGCEARAINLGNKNVKIGIFTGCTSVRSKNILLKIYLGSLFRSMI